jgi:hypothetical protein
MTRLSLTTLLVLILAAVAVFAQHPMRPGRWEVTMQSQMPNMPVQMPEMKTTQCVTEAQLKDPESAVPTASRNSSCKVSDYKTVGNTVSWKVACSGQQAMTGTGEMTFSGDTYTGLMTTKMSQGEMTIKMNGKRLGDCTQ